MLEGDEGRRGEKRRGEVKIGPSWRPTYELEEREEAEGGLLDKRNRGEWRDVLVAVDERRRRWKPKNSRIGK
jgi:hypothetical protein